MRGKHNPQSTMLAFFNLDEHVPPDYPLCPNPPKYVAMALREDARDRGCERRGGFGLRNPDYHGPCSNSILSKGQ